MGFSTPLTARKVKGVLFVDYVRMLRARKDVAWEKHFPPADLPYLAARIEPDAWYPMETFERMGLAILSLIADGNLDVVREFGKAQVDWLTQKNGSLVAQADPRESLMRFHVLRKSYFDYPALEVKSITDGAANIRIEYQMGDVAEEAASFQTMGFFERLLEVAGGKTVQARFATRRWEGDAETVLELRWK
jgi:hypothetical protein